MKIVEKKTNKKSSSFKTNLITMEQKENKKPATKTSKDLLNLENKSREFAF